MIYRLIKRPIAVTMSTIVAIVLGVVASGMLPVGLMPAVDIPSITVRVNAPNLSSREISASIVTPLRSQLMQTSSLRSIESEAKNGSAVITLKMEYGSDIDFLFIDVNERIDKAMGALPKDVPRPSVVKASATDIPSFYLNLSSKTNGDIVELSTFARTIITKRLEQLPQVAFVDISGDQFAELIVEPKTQLIEGAGITVQMIEQAILASDVNLGNLTINDGQYQYNIRFDSKIKNKADIENVVINVEGRLYKIGDLASVTLRQQRTEGLVVADGKPSISLAVVKQSDAKMSDLQREVDKLVDYFEADYPSIQFNVTRDQTELLDYSIGNLKQNLLFGILLAMFVLFLFMKDLRTPLLVTITIPLSLVVSLLFFFVLDISINIISLSGLLLGLGMMVDNSIIVIDNISQRWQRGEPLIDAVARGTSEVFAPMLSSVATTCSIFLPLIFLSGIAGAMFYDQAIAVTIGLVSSLIVAMTIIPVYYYLFYRNNTKRTENRFLAKINKSDYQGAYEKGLRWVFRHQLTTLAIVVGLTFLSVLFYNLLDKRTLPPVDRNDILLSVGWNDRITVEQNAQRTAKFVEAIDGVEHYTSMVGRQRFVLSHTPELSSSDALIYVKSDDVEGVERSARQYIEQNYPNALFSTSQSGNIFDMIFADDEPMLVARLRPTSGIAPEPDKLNEVLGAISERLPGVKIDPVQWQEQLVFYAKPELLSLYGVHYNDLYHTLRASLNENTILQINEGTFRLPVKVSSEQSQSFLDAIEQKTIKNQQKVDIPIKLLVSQGNQRDLRSIITGAEGDYFPLAIDIESRDVQSAVDEIRATVGENPDFEVSFSGSYFTTQDTTRQLIMVLIVSLLLLYFILAAQFESLVQPFIIMSEIVIDISGALFLLWICGSSINIMSLIGIVVMCGIVINDSILKVDTINRLRRSGYSTLRAILMGGHRRLKPIIMTSLTTILAIVPFLFSGGMGNDLQRPLSLALIGGMIVGTIVSVFFIPLLYYIVYRKKK